ncbi:hypothetical protein BCR33DRAFT_343426 [Rhizoclosmatium globosum]|uniref:Uncharacterized protein n=1 Tax=Rhizoclosmatium globosum TaxID=329046 RepID=A0A1Y2C2L8_9FUNG|nr:hypothetical protein BCR33DRAFT_343426 [Rhizoclosmatium globosum]|eukprot:ORY41280.1 hypothetical protein BCR33DRAFT_343426 [Rhizoclosmatium globosum]
MFNFSKPLFSKSQNSTRQQDIQNRHTKPSHAKLMLVEETQIVSPYTPPTSPLLSEVVQIPGHEKLLQRHRLEGLRSILPLELFPNGVVGD